MHLYAHACQYIYILRDGGCSCTIFFFINFFFYDDVLVHSIGPLSILEYSAQSDFRNVSPNL